MGNAIFSSERVWCEASLTQNPPGSDGRGKGCHWSCSVLDGTERRPHGCWWRQRAPACLPGPRWVRPACVCGAHIQSGSSLGSPHLRNRDHKCELMCTNIHSLTHLRSVQWMKISLGFMSWLTLQKMWMVEFLGEWLNYWATLRLTVFEKMWMSERARLAEVPRWNRLRFQTSWFHRDVSARAPDASCRWAMTQSKGSCPGHQGSWTMLLLSWVRFTFKCQIISHTDKLHD